MGNSIQRRRHKKVFQSLVNTSSSSPSLTKHCNDRFYQYIPESILELIFLHLDGRDDLLHNCYLVSHKFMQVVRNLKYPYWNDWTKPHKYLLNVAPTWLYHAQNFTVVQRFEPSDANAKVYFDLFVKYKQPLRHIKIIGDDVQPSLLWGPFPRLQDFTSLKSIDIRYQTGFDIDISVFVCHPNLTELTAINLRTDTHAQQNDIWVSAILRRLVFHSDQGNRGYCIDLTRATSLEFIETTKNCYLYYQDRIMDPKTSIPHAVVVPQRTVVVVEKAGSPTSINATGLMQQLMLLTRSSYEPKAEVRSKAKFHQSNEGIVTVSLVPGSGGRVRALSPLASGLPSQTLLPLSLQSQQCIPTLSLPGAVSGSSTKCYRTLGKFVCTVYADTNFHTMFHLLNLHAPHLRKLTLNGGDQWLKCFASSREYTVRTLVKSHYKSKAEPIATRAKTTTTTRYSDTVFLMSASQRMYVHVIKEFKIFAYLVTRRRTVVKLCDDIIVKQIPAGIPIYADKEECNNWDSNGKSALQLFKAKAQSHIA